MAAAPDNATGAAAPPDKSMRFAATILLVRDAAEGLEVFMVVRHHEIDFASGALVFPGGSVDPDDQVIASDPALYLSQPDWDQAALGLRIAAVRETFEETGILLARPFGSDAIIPAQHALRIEAAHRAALSEGKIAFSQVLKAEKLVLALDWLVPFAHWITPVVMPKRFDTHFFLATAPPDQLGAHDGQESVESIWVTPQRAVEGGKLGTYKLVFATDRNLVKLGRYPTVAAALEAARQRRIVTVTPEVQKREGGRRLRLPPEADYGGEFFDL